MSWRHRATPPLKRVFILVSYLCQLRPLILSMCSTCRDVCQLCTVPSHLASLLSPSSMTHTFGTIHSPTNPSTPPPPPPHPLVLQELCACQQFYYNATCSPSIRRLKFVCTVCLRLYLAACFLRGPGMNDNDDGIQNSVSNAIIFEVEDGSMRSFL